MKLAKLIRENREVGLNDNPQFDRAARFDWRRYVPDNIRELWKEMSVESRVIAKVMAEEAAKQANLALDQYG